VNDFARLIESSGLPSWGQVKRNGREMLRSGVRSFSENDLLTYASAIAFQVVFALIPLALTALALLAFLDLQEVWRSDLAPRVRDAVEADAFTVIDRTVEQIIGQKQILWLTLGAVFALWRVSAAVRTTIPPLNLVFGIEEDRPWRRRFLVSLALALAIGPLVIGSALLIQLGPRLLRSLDLPDGVEVVLYVARWGVALALLALALWALLRYAPAESQSFAWAGLGSAFVLGSWLVTSVAFGFYATRIANYGSLFGNLAWVIVFIAYIYVSSAALLFGIQLDVCVRERVERAEASLGRRAA
jgi:membrane protein